MKVLFNMFLVFVTISSGISSDKSITFYSLNPDMLIEVNKSNNQLFVYDHILNARTKYVRTKGSLYMNEFGDEMVWRSSKLIEFRPKRWRNFVRLDAVKNANVVIEVKKRQRIPNPSVNAVPSSNYIMEITNTTMLEGTWQSKIPDKSLVILATRDGFKIKFIGSNKWINFYLTDQINIFKDDRGNMYFFNSSEEGRWQSQDDVWSVNIRKVTNELRY